MRTEHGKIPVSPQNTYLYIFIHAILTYQIANTKLLLLIGLVLVNLI